MVIGAVFAPWLSPHQPFDLATLDLNDSLLPPAWSAEGRFAYLLGTDDQGRDVLSTILYGSRISLAVGVASVLFAMVLGVGLGLLSGYVGGRLDAFIMRVADVQLSFPAILIALLIDGVARAMLPRDAHSDTLSLLVLIGSIGLANWVQYARTVRGSTLVEKNKEYVQAARVIGVPSWKIMASPRAAQRARAGARDRHDQRRHRHHHRGDALLPRRGRAAHLAITGHDDQHRQQLPVLRRVVARGLPRRSPWCCCACRSTCWATGCATPSTRSCAEPPDGSASPAAPMTAPQRR